MRKPFTLDYARDHTDPALWGSPIFLRTNMVKGHNRHFKLLGALTAKVDGVARQRRGSCLDTNSRKTQRHGKHCTGGHKSHGASRNEGCTTYGSH